MILYLEAVVRVTCGVTDVPLRAPAAARDDDRLGVASLGLELPSNTRCAGQVHCGRPVLGRRGPQGKTRQEGGYYGQPEECDIVKAPRSENGAGEVSGALSPRY